MNSKNKCHDNSSQNIFKNFAKSFKNRYGKMYMIILPHLVVLDHKSVSQKVCGTLFA